jgi:hypothetical protein
MSPGTKRSWVQYFVVIGTAAALVPVSNFFGQRVSTTLIGTALLCLLALFLFRERKRFRTSFLIPLCCVPAFAAAHIRLVEGTDSRVFTLAMAALAIMIVVAFLVDAFWSPRQDDLADLECDPRLGDE